MSESNLACPNPEVDLLNLFDVVNILFLKLDLFTTQANINKI